MSATPSLRNRLRRLEEVIEASKAPVVSLGQRLKAARQAVADRRARGEIRHALPLDVEGRTDWTSRRFAERVNAAGVRFHNLGRPGYEAFSPLAAKTGAAE